METQATFGYIAAAVGLIGLIYFSRKSNKSNSGSQEITEKVEVSSASKSNNLEVELQKAKKMLSDGLITEDEFAAIKKRLIDSM